ncbi:hypothetical protein ACO0K7_14680 [Undibacterium sp. Ji67W]|uniref:hypothetical protein n=1 Tax=Undibacterium sp. Ji67W TaxID=3413042 RepID=UPI003BF3D969
MRVLILDADSHLGSALASSFFEVGHEVVLHTRSEYPAFSTMSGVEHVVTSDPAEKLVDWFDSRKAPQCIVFNLKAKDEFGVLRDDGDMEELITQLSEDLPGFLRELQAFALLLARAGEGVIWVLVQEESAAYYVPVPISSIVSKARIAAVKSIAKEVARFEVKVNAISLQAYREQLSDGEWKSARDGLKAFALKFKPINANEIADTICRLSEVPSLPIVGMVLSLGVGMPEFNI